MGLRDLFTPHLYLAAVVELAPEHLRARGIRGVILDLDNTLVRWNHPVPGEELRRWVAALHAHGLRACIVSNNTTARVEAFARALGVPAIARAVKPRRGPYRRAMALMGTAPAETAVVGDQVFTDVLGGRRLGLYTVLVAPVGEREFVGTRLVRLLERAWLRYLARRGLVALPPAAGAPAAGRAAAAGRERSAGGERDDS